MAEPLRPKPVGLRMNAVSIRQESNLGKRVKDCSASVKGYLRGRRRRILCRPAGNMAQEVQKK